MVDCVRCSAVSRRGRQCSRSTCKYSNLCWQHTQSQLQLKIAPSGIKESGDGLFTLKAIKKGETVTPYEGKLMTTTEWKQNPSEYGIQITKNYVIDARSTQSGLGRWANDCRPQNRADGDCANNNCKFSINRQRKTAKIVATRNIPAGAELFVSYGANYWK